MKIALIGYGKMGRAIEAEALKKGHSVGVCIDNEDDWAAHGNLLSQCDVALEFTTPATAVGNVRRCFAAGTPVVVGTTGWNAELETLKTECLANGGGLFVASNFSIGMNVMFALTRRLAELMGGRTQFAVDISEKHHIHKLDKPSGTAITLAEEVIGAGGGPTKWMRADESDGCADTLPISSIREGECPGEHTVSYRSATETLQLSHMLHDRSALAVGAVLAAEYMEGKRGFHTMSDLLGE
ncbi:MAG: 4-hydroxy-tetrahydrodipicolinate reductase [Bacteroidales bacterium]|nr:4-hydroxy-tetrahydrodipicolinate reductase [Bacteroidales bacterium]